MQTKYILPTAYTIILAIGVASAVAQQLVPGMWKLAVIGAQAALLFGFIAGLAAYVRRDIRRMDAEEAARQ